LTSEEKGGKTDMEKETNIHKERKYGRVQSF
jgi:hypothetical protein